MNMRVAVRANLTGMNTSNLAFYSYDLATNKYARLYYPQYAVDANGYIHFTVAVGNELVISEGPLVRK